MRWPRRKPSGWPGSPDDQRSGTRRRPGSGRRGGVLGGGAADPAGAPALDRAVAITVRRIQGVPALPAARGTVVSAEQPDQLVVQRVAMEEAVSRSGRTARRETATRRRDGGLRCAAVCRWLPHVTYRAGVCSLT